MTQNSPRRIIRFCIKVVICTKFCSFSRTFQKGIHSEGLKGQEAEEKPNSGSGKARWMSVKGLIRSPRKQTPKPAVGKLRMNPIYICRSPQMSGSEGRLQLSLRSSVMPSPLSDPTSLGNCLTLPEEQGPRTEGHWACKG